METDLETFFLMYKKQSKRIKVNNAIQKIFHRIEFNTNNDCWEWQGRVRNGYGYCYFLGITYAAHGFIWMLVNKEEPEHHIHHTCENKICVNPAHLEHLTATEHQRRHKISEKSRRAQMEEINSGIKILFEDHGITTK